jgi:hypothetical protein
MSHKINIPSKEELEKKYIELISISAVARYFNTSNPTVRKWLINYGIERKSHAVASAGVNRIEKPKTRLSDETYKKLNSYDYLYDARINRKLSYENIGKELGCSEIPVKAACIALDIPKVRHNESQPMVMVKLRDKTWLTEKHINQHVTLQDIANEIGSSKATVSVWMRYHGIITNNPNSYDRVGCSSKECDELSDFIKSLGFDIETNNRTILNGFELDIVVPSKKIAFEYNGVFSHLFRPEESKFSTRKDAKYHLFKTEESKRHGYDLIHIFSDDWKYRNEICKSIIRSKLGVSDRLFGRKCLIKRVSSKAKSEFLNLNHIQGNDKSTIYYGLIYEDVLVAVMTFCKSRYNKHFDWELSRFASKCGITIVGGFSKLLKRFESEFSGSIISYADRSRSNGNVYRNNGFTLIKTNPPGYSYVNLNMSEQRFHRAAFMKKRIAPNDTRTEREIMRERGYHQIFDCGSLAFGKNI